MISKVKTVVRVTPTKDSAITNTGSHIAKSFHTFIYPDLGRVRKCMIRLVDTGEAKNSLPPPFPQWYNVHKTTFIEMWGYIFFLCPNVTQRNINWEQVGKMLTTQFRGQLRLFDPESYSISVF